MRPELDYMWRKKMMTTNFTKQPPLLEDLRSHTAEQLAELRLLLTSGAPSRPDPRRPGFFELDGTDNVFYVFKYPTGTKVLLVGVSDRKSGWPQHTHLYVPGVSVSSYSPEKGGSVPCCLVTKY